MMPDDPFEDLLNARVTFIGVQRRLTNQLAHLNTSAQLRR
jgi:hypothetical protein